MGLGGALTGTRRTDPAAGAKNMGKTGMEVKNSEGTQLTTAKQREFEEEFEWLVREKRWTQQDIAEAREAMAVDAGVIRYLWVLARAMKQGYRCDAESGYERLVDFCARTGLPSPQSRRDA